MYYYFNDKNELQTFSNVPLVLPGTTEVESDVDYSGKWIVLSDEGIVEVVEETTETVTKEMALTVLSEETAKWITSGFKSSAVESGLLYDSTAHDQLTLTMMHAASLSPNFETTAPYYGAIPIRAKRELSADKEIFNHNATQMQLLIDDLALHLGDCKKRGWLYQVRIAEADSPAELESIVEELKGGG